MKRLIYFIDNQINIIHQNKNQIELLACYENNQQGLEQFEKYLKISIKQPIQILLDIIDEDFFLESIPHVLGRDQKAIIKRKVERLFNNNFGFYYSQIQGRDKQGRRNDKLFLSGLNNADFLNTLLKLLHQHHVPVAAIWSLPLLNLSLIKRLKLNDDKLLIVSRQNDDHLRLSFINNKQFSMSRMVTLHNENIFELIKNEIEQTIKYLANKRYFGFNDQISVCLIVKASNLAFFKQQLKDSPTIKYILYSGSEIENLLNIKNGKLDGKNNFKPSYNIAAYSQLCLQQNIFKDHYSHLKEKKSYYAYLSKKVFLFSSFVFFISCLLLSQVYLTQGWETSQKSKNLALVEESYKQSYEQVFSSQEAAFKHASFKRSAVLLTTKIAQYKKINPLNFYLQLSNAYARSGLETIHFDKINWTFNQLKKDLNNQANNEQNNATLHSTQNDEDSGSYPNSMVYLHGRLPLFDNQYRDAVSQLSLLVESIKLSDQVKEIKILKYPIDIRSNYKVDGLKDMIEQLNDDNLLSFELEIMLSSKMIMQAGNKP